MLNRLPAIVALLCAAAPLARAAAPTLDSLYPAGAPRGSTITVTASGKFDPTPIQLWADTPSIKFEPGKKPGEFTITIAPDAPLGPHAVRAHSPEGASALKCFIVGDQPEIAETEPNDEPSKAQPATRPSTQPSLPLTINAQLEKSGDVDCYAVDLKSGQTLVAAVQGRRIGSTIDPLLHVLDPIGNEVAFAHDGFGLDPLLAYRATADGRYVVRISAFAHPPAADVKFTGGKTAPYRLSLTTGPFVRAAVPAALKRGTKSTLRLVGWNLQSDKLEVDATAVLPTDDRIFVPIPADLGRLEIPLTDATQICEESFATTQPALIPPVNITAAVSKPGEEDRFTLTAKKGQRLTVRVDASAPAAFAPAAAVVTLDPVLRIEDPAGKSLASDDDSDNGAEPRIEWTAPDDGAYHIVVFDRFHKGGDDYRYRLAIELPIRRVITTLDADTFTLAAGKSAAVKFKYTRRHGHADPLVAVVTGLPAGVTATSADVPAKESGDITLTLTAAADAKPASVPIRVVLLGTDPQKLQSIPALIDFRKDREKPGIPELLDHAADAWLTVTPPPKTTQPSTLPAKGK